MNGEGLDIYCHASGPVLAQQTELVIFALISHFYKPLARCVSLIEWFALHWHW